MDAKSEKIVSFRVTKGNVHDSKKFSPMIREVSEAYSIDNESCSPPFNKTIKIIFWGCQPLYGDY